MKQLLLAALLALVASEAHAQRVNFDYTGKLDTFTVPETGTYQIVAFGAQAGEAMREAPLIVTWAAVFPAWAGEAPRSAATSSSQQARPCRSPSAARAAMAASPVAAVVELSWSALAARRS